MNSMADLKKELNLLWTKEVFNSFEEDLKKFVSELNLNENLRKLTREERKEGIYSSSFVSNETIQICSFLWNDEFFGRSV